ncbi:unnamed protein product, partial [Mesorhabditis spiculigera]
MSLTAIGRQICRTTASFAICSTSTLPRTSNFDSRAFTTSATLRKGHSHWQNIRATKEKNDTQRARAINLLLQKMRSAVKGGYDSKLNRNLAAVEAEFLKQGLGMDTYKRTLQRLKDQPDVTIYLAVIGPSSTFFVVHMEAPTRAAAEGALNKYVKKIGGGFRVAPDLSAIKSWFEEKGVLLVGAEDEAKKKWTQEEMEELCIEIECEEVNAVEDLGEKKFEIICQPLDVNKVENTLRSKGISVETAQVEFRALHPVSPSEADTEKITKFYQLLEDDEMVGNIFDNIESA